MQVKIIHNKEEIRNFLKKRIKENYMFHFCDMDDFWEYNQFYGMYEENELKATAIYSIMYGTPILVATSYGEKNKYQDELVKSISKFLPDDLYCHLDFGAYEYLEESRVLIAREKYYNMKLNKNKFTEVYSDFDNRECVKNVNASEKQEILDFYDENYPGYMIEEKYLDNGLFYEIRSEDKNEIISLAGIFSDSKEVIQIGNVITREDYRRKGVAEKCIYELIKQYLSTDKEVVLNVLQNNKNALNLYNKMCFEVIGEFEEVVFESK